MNDVEVTYLLRGHSKNGYIYKIGKTKDLIHRFNTHQTSNPTIELMGISYVEELVFHNKYSDYRMSVTKLNGKGSNREWFEFPEHMVESVISEFDCVDYELLQLDDACRSIVYDFDLLSAIDLVKTINNRYINSLEKYRRLTNEFMYFKEIKNMINETIRIKTIY